MNVARVCTGVLFLIVSLGIQILNWWLLAKSLSDNNDWLIIPVIIFLWNVMAPVIFIYMMLIERGLI
jgi:hypothetical protein